jgi:hypothetical protein
MGKKLKQKRGDKTEKRRKKENLSRRIKRDTHIK